jgi:hypothetical protein
MPELLGTDLKVTNRNLIRKNLLVVTAPFFSGATAYTINFQW